MSKFPYGDVEHRPNHFGIEMSSGARYQFLTGGLGAYWALVDTHSGHDFECIYYCDDPASQADLLSHQTTWISLTVETFMMVGHGIHPVA